MAVIPQPLDRTPPAREPLLAAGASVRGPWRRPSRMNVLVGRALRAPLILKLLGANALIAVAALVVAVAIEGRDGTHPQLLWVLGGALAAALVANVVLVGIALRPLRALIAVAEDVRAGQLDRRVPGSPVADRELARLGRTLNSLLDELGAERARLRELAAEVIEAGDRERERIAAELHDSTAQRVAALVLHLGAVLNDGANERVRGRLAPAKQIADEVLEELRTLAHVMHPRVLHHLGLPHALSTLARETSSPAAVVDTWVDAPEARLPIEVESVLYRVAQEAVSNALRHGRPEHVMIELRVGAMAATLQVEDDGRGFDASAPSRDREQLGMFTMRERMSLVGGRLEVDSRPGAGTRVRATVPLDGRA